MFHLSSPALQLPGEGHIYDNVWSALHYRKAVFDMGMSP